MWGDKRQKGEDDDSEEESEEDEESESDSDDGLGGSTRAGPSRVSFASPPTQSQSTSSTSQSTTNQPQLKPGDIDKFGNVVQEPEMTKREAKKAAKAKEAAKAQQGKQAEESDSESDSDDPLLQAGSGNKTLNKQMKMSSLGDTAKKPAAAPQPMNRKERCVHLSILPAAHPEEAVVAFLGRKQPRRLQGNDTWLVGQLTSLTTSADLLFCRKCIEQARRTRPSGIWSG